MPIHESELVETPRPKPARGSYWYRKEDGVQVCGSKKKKSDGLRCAQSKGSLFPNGRCRHHGGQSPGPPLTAGGIHSIRLGPLKEAYERILFHDELRNTDEPLAILALVEGELLEAAEEGDSPAWRKELLDAFEELRKAKLLPKDRRSAAIADATEALGTLIEDGHDRAQALLEVAAIAKKRADAIQADRSIALREERTIPEATLVVLIAMVQDIIRENAPHDIASRITTAVSRRLMGSGHGAGDGARLIEAAAS